MRETLAKILAVATALVVTALAAVFSLAQNEPGRTEAPAASARQPAPSAAVQAGREAYDRHGCAGCHAIGGQGNPRNPLDGVGGRLKPDEIRDWTVAAPTVRPKLPAGVVRVKQGYAGLPEAELKSLVAYLGSLRGPGKGG